MAMLALLGAPSYMFFGDVRRTELSTLSLET